MNQHRSRFARLSVQLQHGGVNQKEMNYQIDADDSINEDTKIILKTLVQTSTSKRDSLLPQPVTQASSPLIKSPMKYRRGNSLILLKNIDIMRIKQAENEGFLTKSRFNNLKIFEERKNKLSEALSNKDQKIDMKDTYIQNLSVEIAVKAIKTYMESQFILRIFTENTIFTKYDMILKKNRNFINALNYEFFPKNSVIYETGDFGQNYYFLLSGKLLQLLPANEEIESSPTKLSNIRGMPHKPQLSLFNISHNHCTNTPRTLIRNQSRDLKNSSLNLSISHQNSLINETQFLSFVPQHKFNQYILPGQGFGETELLSRQRRGCTIFCDEDSHLLSITKDTFDKIMGEEKLELINKKILFFQQFEFLEGVPNNKLMQVIDQSITINMSSKNVLYTEGQECDSIYFIRKGEIHLNKILETNTNLLNLNQEQKDAKQLSLENEPDLYKAMINRKKKKQERFPILILSENSYFGEYEILKKMPQRITQAICTSQDCEVIEVKANKLFSLVKNFGKFSNLIKNEKIREEFMNERLELINNQKQEQINNRIAQTYNYQSPSNSKLKDIRDKQDSLLSSATSSPQSQNIKQPIILKNDNVPMRIKFQTQSYDFDNQCNPFQKLPFPTYSPGTNRKNMPFTYAKLEDFNLTKQATVQPITRSERNISLTGIQFEPIQQNQNQVSNVSSTSNFISAPYDFSIKESKEQVIKELHQSHGKSIEPQQNLAKQKSLYLDKRIKFSNSASNSPQQINSKNIEISNQKNELNNLKKEMQKNLFQTFVENAEKNVLQKQAIMQKLSQNNLSLKNTTENAKPSLFEDEFSKGFNNMYLRKFGKKYEKK